MEEPAREHRLFSPCRWCPVSRKPIASAIVTGFFGYSWMTSTPTATNTWMRLLAGTLILLLAISIFAFSYDVRVEPFDDLLPPSVISAPGPETNGYLCLENKWMERVNLKDPNNS